MPDLNELYAEFGMAAEMAQLLEVEAGSVGLAFLAISVKSGEKVPAAQREFYQQIVDHTNRQNLGKLLRMVQSIGTFSPSMTETIEQALERRNYLTHRFFRTHNFAIHNETGRAAMIRELREIHAQLSIAVTMLSGVGATLLALAGHEDLSKEAHDEFIAKGERLDI
ncbi:MAG: hypothetical protein WD803_09770 [Gammaproteobacteria bacterium]